MSLLLGALAIAAMQPAPDLAIRGDEVMTMGPRGTISRGVVLIGGGKILAVGSASEVSIPPNVRTLSARVVLPGLIDGRATVGLTGILNSPGHDQDQLDRSGALQPELRAIDAYNPLEKLVGYLRGYGVTTVHTGHAPGAAISGGTFIVKTDGKPELKPIVADFGVAATVDPSALRGNPGTRAKLVYLLRNELLKAKAAMVKPKAEVETNLRQSALQRVLRGEAPLVVYANRAQDILAALRLKEEFGFRMMLDSGAEAYLVADALKQAAVPVLLHPPMARARGELENLSYGTAADLEARGIPFAFTSGFEGYVPKVRVVLFEAAVAAANDLKREVALGRLTIEAARLLGIDARVGSLEPGKDADLALFDGDPLETTRHCLGTVIDGRPYGGESAWRSNR